MGAALKFKQTQVPKQQGEFARLKVIRGPDVGAVFVINGPRASIGRGEENDVVLTDLKASRRHAELILTQSGWSVQDLGSANGILCNGTPSRSGGLKTKDTLGLGETLFEFMSQDAGTMLLQAPPTTEKQIQTEQAGLAAQRAKVIAMSQFGGLAKNRPRPEKLSPLEQQAAAVASAPAQGTAPAANPRTLVLIVVALIAAYFLMDGPVKSRITSKKIKEAKQDQPLLDSGDEEIQQIEKSADMFYRIGFREYNEGNYLRARTQFETVLQMQPNHLLAKIYLENSNKAIDDDVKRQLYMGRKDECSGKTREARGHYESVIRLLYRDPSNPAFIQAKDHLEQMGKDKAKEECKG